MLEYRFIIRNYYTIPETTENDVKYICVVGIYVYTYFCKIRSSITDIFDFNCNIWLRWIYRYNSICKDSPFNVTLKFRLSELLTGQFFITLLHLANSSVHPG